MKVLAIFRHIKYRRYRRTGHFPSQVERRKRSLAAQSTIPRKFSHHLIYWPPGLQAPLSINILMDLWTKKATPPWKLLPWRRIRLGELSPWSLALRRKRRWDWVIV